MQTALLLLAGVVALVLCRTWARRRAAYRAELCEWRAALGRLRQTKGRRTAGG